jgi:hypothetical protein
VEKRDTERVNRMELKKRLRGLTDEQEASDSIKARDDIPRLAAAEQAKEQRPNAYKHARNQLLPSGT